MTFLAFIALAIVAHLINARALRHLDPEQKLVVVTEIQSSRMVWPLIALGVAYAALLVFERRVGFTSWLLAVFMATTFLVLVASSVIDLRRLQSRALPRSYIRTQGFTRLLLLVGLLVVLGDLLFTTWSIHHR